MDTRVELEGLDIFTDFLLLLPCLCLIPSSGLETGHSGPDSRGEGSALVPQNGPGGQGGCGGAEWRFHLPEGCPSQAPSWTDPTSLPGALDGAVGASATEPHCSMAVVPEQTALPGHELPGVGLPCVCALSAQGDEAGEQGKLAEQVASQGSPWGGCPTVLGRV